MNFLSSSPTGRSRILERTGTELLNGAHADPVSSPPCLQPVLQPCNRLVSATTSRFQAMMLVASPLYPNAVVWSDENLIAVASGHLVTILNPAVQFGPRGIITLPIIQSFPIGVIKREDLLSDCMLPTALSRDRRPYVRSVSWSPLGMASNSGCLLAVCSTEGRVKVYRPPFHDFCTEWIEVIDISVRLFDYLTSVNFEELNFHSPGISATVPFSKYKSKRPQKMQKSCSSPPVSSNQYAFRSAMLSSLVVSWSPLLHIPSKTSTNPLCDLSRWCSLLAIGAKSGKISFWRFHTPKCYSIEHSEMSTVATLVGILQAHNSWVTVISWAVLTFDSSSPRIILSTGSCDGSVRIWECVEGLLESTEVKLTPFYLLKEVIPVDMTPVSVLTVLVPVQSAHKMLLAVGKGSGSFEAWICDISGYNFDKLGAYNVHENVITGLCWTSNGYCLYSCSQDNFVRSWILNGTSLVEVPIPSQIPGVRGVKVPDSFLSCFGIAISPANLVVAMVRSFNVDLLHPMYQARAHKAVVEFFHIGGQQVDTLLNTSSEFDTKAFPRLLDKEFALWESNILWSLKQYEHPDKPLVVWDIITALLAFKQCAPKYVERILVKWLLTSYVRSHVGYSINEIIAHVFKNISKISSRKLQLLNVICRRVILSKLKADEIEINSEVHNLEACDFEQEELTLWMELLMRSERELRERLVVFTFSTFTSLMSYSSIDYSQLGYWYPFGVAQMESWAVLNHDSIHDKLKALVSEVRTQRERLESADYAPEEYCGYCSVPVQFESPEVAFCEGVNEAGQNHKLVRCAISMQICPSTPLWLCICCHRRASKLAPETLFTMTRYPLDLKYSTESYVKIVPKPLCPFCGVLLQRSQPDFLLSASPV